MKSENVYIVNADGSKTLVETTEIIDDLSSVGLTISAKGVVQPEVKVYDKDPELASNKAQEILNGIVSKYSIKLSTGE